jgi:hypothetical protein
MQHIRKILKDYFASLSEEERAPCAFRGRTNMETSYRQRSTPKHIITGLVVAACCFVAVGHAHAYGALTMRYARVDTSTCTRLSGDLPVKAFSNGCELDDEVDGTFFEKDAGGIALKVVLSDSNGMVAKVEFHPYGEKLWVYDTRNDGDGIYVQLYGPNGHFTYGVTGTSDPIDYNVYDLNYPEGTLLYFDVTDDQAGNDVIYFDSYGCRS